MRNVAFVMIGLIVLLVCSLLPGCGGEGGVGTVVTIVGAYTGISLGDATGIIKFFVNPGGVFTGNITLPPVCVGTIAITGTVDPVTGAVTFSGSGCGITFSGSGTLTQTSPGVWTGSGTWSGSNGSSGTWAGTRTGSTGSISI